MRLWGEVWTEPAQGQGLSCCCPSWDLISTKRAVLKGGWGVGSAERRGFESSANQLLEFLTSPRCLSEEAGCQRGGSSPRPRVFYRLDSHIPKIERELVILFRAVAPELKEYRKRRCALWDPDKGISTSCARDSIHLCNIWDRALSLTTWRHLHVEWVSGSTLQEKELCLTGWRWRTRRVGETASVVIHYRKMNAFLFRHIFTSSIIRSQAFATPANVMFQRITGNS